MVIELIAVIAQAVHSAKFIYSIEKDSVVRLDYEKLSVVDRYKDPFIKACNNGECDVLNLDGSETGMTRLPSSLRITRLFQHQNLFVTEANGISTYFFEGRKIEVPKNFQQPKFMLDRSKICTDTTIYLAPLSLKSGKSKSRSKNQNGFASLIQQPQTVCYDLNSRVTNIIPLPFTVSFFGMGIFSGGYGASNYGYVYGNGKIIHDSLKNCEEKVFLDGSIVVQCFSFNQNAGSWKDVTIDSAGNRFPSRLGSIFEKYKGLIFSVKRDEYGSDSTIVSKDTVRISSHAFFRPIPFLNSQGYCMLGDGKETICYSLPEKNKFRSKMGLSQFVSIVGSNSSDTLGFDSWYRLNQFTDAFFEKQRYYSGIMYAGSKDEFLVASAGNPYSANPGLIHLKLGVSDSLIADNYLPASGRIERIGKYFVVGLDEFVVQY
ncbi:MAG: hypothetical protein IPN71_23140 [Fibrobacteres bacterium]|nr:hypothetical protein [Fibrobacterota bacterium]